MECEKDDWDEDERAEAELTVSGNPLATAKLLSDVEYVVASYKDWVFNPEMPGDDEWDQLMRRENAAKANVSAFVENLYAIANCIEKGIHGVLCLSWETDVNVYVSLAKGVDPAAMTDIELKRARRHLDSFWYFLQTTDERAAKRSLKFFEMLQSVVQRELRRQIEASFETPEQRDPAD